MIEHIKQGFEILGHQTVSHTGFQLVGQHSYRNFIAVFLAEQKIDVWKIQGLLRHSTQSEHVLGYIREAHIRASTDLVEEAAPFAQNFACCRAKP